MVEVVVGEWLNASGMFTLLSGALREEIEPVYWLISPEEKVCV